MNLVDVHCHLHHEDFDSDLDEVLKRASGIKIITNGLELKSNKKTLEIAEKYHNVFPALGFYPLEKNFSETLEHIQKNIDKIIAIGEIGLDYKYTQNKSQVECFKNMVALAQDNNLPVIVHSRRAEKEIIEILSKTDLKVVLHCFTGKLSLARKAADNGWFFSVPAIIKTSTHFQRLAEEIPIENLLTETDSPLMSPDDNRNEPKNVEIGIEKIAEIKGLEKKQCAEIIYDNFKSVFNQ